MRIAIATLQLAAASVATEKLAVLQTQLQHILAVIASMQH
jgi:hypothetical protein